MDGVCRLYKFMSSDVYPTNQPKTQGIGDSRGVMWDFAGPYTIGTRKLAFGAPTRFFQLTLQGAQEARAFDAAVQETNACYSQRMHNLCCDNCHSHVARALNTFGYAAYRRWNMVLLCFMVFFRGRFVSPGAVAKTWGPFAALVVVALVIKYK